MLQKVIWGGVDNPDQSWITDLNSREIITLAPFLVFVLWIGLSPGPFMEMMDYSVTELLDQFNAYKAQSVAAAEILARR
jgi:NADH-quinone oxidoreductase subunit M